MSTSLVPNPRPRRPERSSHLYSNGSRSMHPMTPTLPSSKQFSPWRPLWLGNTRPSRWGSPSLASHVALSPPPAGRFTRAVVVERGPAGITVTNAGTPRHFSGYRAGDELTAQTSLVVNELQALTQVDTARVYQAGSRTTPSGDTMDIRGSCGIEKKKKKRAARRCSGPQTCRSAPTVPH